MPRRLTLLVDPSLHIIDASSGYRRATLVGFADVRGALMFDVFPDNPTDVAADGVSHLHTSFERVLRSRAPHRLGLQRYDVRDRIAGDDSWIEKIWLVVNTPLFADGSDEIVAIEHEVRDVTIAVRRQRELRERVVAIDEQRATLARIERDLADDRERVLAENERIERALTGPVPLDVPLDPLEDAALDDGNLRRAYFAAGELAPVAGLYDSFHIAGCPYASRRHVVSDESTFSRCPGCLDRVVYRLARRLP